MKVLHVIPAIAPRYGGPSRAVLGMCRALHSQKVETLIATTDADGDGRLRVALGKPIVYQDVPTIFFARQWSEAFKYSRSLKTWLEEQVKEFDAVHIHAVFSHSCLAASRACRRWKVPYIVRPLGTLAPWSLRQKSTRKRLMWHAAIRSMMQQAAAIHYTTAAERAEVEQSLGLHRGIVIPLPIDLRTYESASLSEGFRETFPEIGRRPYILVMSRLHPKKALDVLIRAFADLVRQADLSHWRLVLAGEGELAYTAHLRHVVQEAQIAQNVVFTGWLDGKMKLSALQQAELLALPSYQENFGLCVIEALACGVPVLVSPYVNLASEIDTIKAGWIADVTLASLGDVLAEALEKADERARRGAQGREFARRFAPAQISSDLLRLYSAITKADISPIQKNVFEA